MDFNYCSIGNPKIQMQVLSIRKSRFRSQNLDLRISNRTENLKTDFVADSLIRNPCRVRISINKLRREIRFRILCSIGNPKIRILRSKSGFPNQKHPKSRFPNPLGCFRLGNPDFDVKIWIFGFPVEHKI